MVRAIAIYSAWLDGLDTIDFFCFFVFKEMDVEPNFIRYCDIDLLVNEHDAHSKSLYAINLSLFSRGKIILSCNEGHIPNVLVVDTS